MRYVLAFLLMLSGSFGFATEFVVPQQEIFGASKPYELGDLCRLWISPLKKTPNLESVSYVWRVRDGFKDKVFETKNNDSRIFFGAGIKPKSFRADVAATYLYVVREGDKTKEIATRTVFLSVEVAIEGDKPPPIPQPVGPNFEHGTFGLAKFSFDLCQDIPVRSRKASVALANVFRGMASQASAKTISSPRDLLLQTTANNDAALKQLGITTADWDQFFNPLEEKLFGLNFANNAKGLSDLVTAWREIAAGLDKVK